MWPSGLTFRDQTQDAQTAFAPRSREHVCCYGDNMDVCDAVSMLVAHTVHASGRCRVFTYLWQLVEEVLSGDSA